MAPERTTATARTVQKLGVKPDERVEVTGDVGSGLRGDVKEALGRGLVRSGDLDGAIVPVESLEDAEEALVRYRARLRDSGYLWIITRKRGHDDYLNQMTLVPARQARGPDRQQDLLDRRRPLGHPLRGPARAAQAGARSRA